MSISVDQREIQAFSKDSSHWWDETGPFAPLHKLNPVRLSYIKDQICNHFKRDAMALDAYQGLKVLDIGCGGGLVCEPMARLGAEITGVDADAQAIEVANEHAGQSGLDITYISGAAEDLIPPPPVSSRRKPGSGSDKQPDSGVRRNDNNGYDVVLALEIIEHVTDPATFVESCAKLVKPGGLLIMSTLNRTPRSYALGIIAAEHILRWVPRGTHSWKKFIKPSELSRFGRAAGLTPHDITGLIYNPLKGFTLSKTDIAVNYLMTLNKMK
jgi:2-polyprenyl-6-hydroxyphenyl methylase/3-demethylubiquinone-9 3-methyltransferase